jgi:Secretion system C-terminal sorting domain/Metallo-peptidase family M12
MKLYHIFIGLFFMVIASVDTIGQQTFFMQSFPQPQVTLNNGELTLFNTYAVAPSTQSIQLVKLSDVNNVQSGGLLSINVPGEPGSFTMRVERAEYQDQNNYVWQGKRMVTDTLVSPDLILLIKENGRISGSVAVDGHYYTIFPLSVNFQVLIRNKELQQPIDSYPPGEHSPEESCVMGTSQCVTDILILYTSGALAQYPDMGVLGKMCIQQLKSAFVRSGISQQVRLVGIEQMPGAWINQTSATDEALSLQTSLSFPNSPVSQLRNAVDADLVVLLSSGVNYASGASIGHANEIPAGTLSNGSAVVKASAAVSNAYVFAHETGHLFGGRHQDDSDDLPARAHEFDGTFHGHTYHYLTIMHTNSNQILNYSNPNKTYLSVATGTSDRFNACKIQDYGCGVSQIVASDICRVRATGSFSCAQNRLTVSAQFKQENGTACPVSYWQFDVSFDGVNYTNGIPILFGNTVINYPACTNTIFLRIKAFDSGLNVLSSSFEMFSPPALCQCVPSSGTGGGSPRPLVNNEDVQSPMAPVKVSIIPNPANDLFELQIETEGADEISLEIFNQQGVQVLSLPSMEVGKGTQLFAVDVANLPAGMYSVRGVGKVYSFVRQFVKL